MCQGGDFTKHNGTGGAFLIFEYLGHISLGYTYFFFN